MQTKILATLTQTRDRQPLASVRNLPGDDADLTPSQLRALADVLCKIADASEAMPMSANFLTKQCEFEVTTKEVHHD